MKGEGEERRSRHYIDRRLQWWLIGLLLVIQVVVLGGGLLLIHHSLAAAVEAQFYRAHPADTSMRELLLHELFEVVPGLLMVEVMALAAVLWGWQRRVDAVIGPLASILRGDASPEAVAPSHPLLQEATRLMEGVRREETTVRQVVGSAVSALDRGDMKAACRVLQEMDSKMLHRREVAPKPLDG